MPEGENEFAPTLKGAKLARIERMEAAGTLPPESPQETQAPSEKFLYS